MKTPLPCAALGRCLVLLVTASAVAACPSPRNDPSGVDADPGSPAGTGGGRMNGAGGAAGSNRGKDGPDLPVMVCGSVCDAEKSDGCCPVGCTGASDLDCPARCGNMVLEKGEECDPPGSCPAACPDRGCTRFTLEGTASECTARCVESGRQTSCQAGDGCCPAGCTIGNDADCMIMCGNGVKEGGETCDPLSSCPSTCPSEGCQLRKLVNGGSCTAECVNDRQQTVCAPGDGCCPPGCNSANDGDCQSKCGNGVVEPGETCEPAECTTRQNACKSDPSTAREGRGSPSTCTFECVETARRCGDADGFCPAGCSNDPDCKRASGSACDSASQCQSNRCTDGFCCSEGCGTCEKCTGSGGTCQIPSGTKVCDGRCISSNDCCGCDTSTRCSGNRVVRGVCNSGSCSTVEVTSCSECETCSGSSCRPKCSGSTRCVGGSCKKADGQNCSSGGECASGSCNGPKTCEGGSTADCPCTDATIVEDCESQDCRQRQKKCGDGYNLPNPGPPGFCTHYP